MEVSVEVVNAFVDQGQGGNPAGVVLDAERLTQQQKQQIAARVGLSETAFVSPSSSADFKLEFFTPTRQIAHCGHATIATFSFLRQSGRITQPQTSKETIDGRRGIYLDGDMAFMQQLAPRYIELDTTDTAGVDVLKSIALDASCLLDGLPPLIVNTGNSFMIVPLRDEAAVLKARPDIAAIEAISERLDLIGYYLFSPQTRIAGRHAGARMFAPRYGIAEEAATGMAAGPLACFLHDRLQLRASSVLIEQGHLMSPPSPSIIEVQLKTANGQIQSLVAGGRAAVAERRTVRL